MTPTPQVGACTSMACGLWPQLRKYVTIVTATTAVGPTHGFTISYSVRSTSFMGDLQGGQDRAASALTRSQGLLMTVSPPMPAGLIANFIAPAHACKSSMHVRDHWRTPSFWLIAGRARRISAHGARAQPRQLPSCQQEIDLQNTPSLRQAHVVAQKVENTALLYYRDVTSHSWRDVTYFTSGMPEEGGCRGKAQIKKRLIRDANDRVVQAEFTFAMKRIFHKRNS